MVTGIIIICVLIMLLSSTVKIVSQGHVYIIERFGKYRTTFEPGLHFIIPVVDRVAKRITLKEQVADFPPQNVITKDNVMIKIDAIVYFKVVDPKMYSYGAEQPIVALKNISATTLRNLIGDLELDQTLTSRDKINASMLKIIDEATDPWGIKVSRVEIQDILPPEEIQHSMEKQMKAERDRRETLLEAEGHKQASITKAEGDKQALVLKAEAERDAAIAKAKGQAEAIRLVYEAEARGIEMLKEANMDERVLLIKKLEALEKLGNGTATKIVVPTDLAGAAADLTFKSEMLGLADMKNEKASKKK